MNKQIILEKLIKENLDQIAEFLWTLVEFDGVLNAHKLHKVIKKSQKYDLVMADYADKITDYSIGIGGECGNSFTTLYEAGYFMRALFLIGIGTYYLKSGFIHKSKFRSVSKFKFLWEIKNGLSKLSFEAIYDNIENSLISIYSSLDTDIAPIRYNKHQLWGLDEKVLKYKVSQINRGYFQNQYNYKPEFANQYWTLVDEQIAQTSLQSSPNLATAKAISFYQTMEIICEFLELDIAKIPIFFNFVPQEEVLSGGINQNYLKILNNLTNSEFISFFKKETSKDHPWFLATSCPNCGNGHKVSVSANLIQDGQIVSQTCRQGEYFGQTESGEKYKLTGCGFSWQFEMPKTPQAWFEFFQKYPITLHFSIRWLICLLMDSVDSPLGFVLYDIGVKKVDSKIISNSDFAKGYGDHRQMLTNALKVQNYVINSDWEIVKNLRKTGEIRKKPIYLFGSNNPTKLVDSEVKVPNTENLFVSDTSFLKQLQKGRNIWEMFYLANSDLEVFYLEKLEGVGG